MRIGSRRVLAGAVLALALTGCGSTIQYGATGSARGTVSAGDGLGLGTDGVSNGQDSPTDLPTIPVGSPSDVSTGDPLAPESSSPTGEAPSTAGSGSVTAVTTPLTVGLAYIDNSGSSASLGFSSGQTVNAKSTMQAYVRGLNAMGGFNGRQIKTVEFTFNGQSPNYDTLASAACAKFTQDYHVQVVIDGAFGTTGGFRECMQKAGVFVLANQVEGDRTLSTRYPLHVNTMNLTTDRAYGALVSLLNKPGYVTKTNQIGVLLEECPENRDAYERTVLPLVKRLGLKAPKLSTIDCTVGFSSAAGAATAINGAVLSFRSAGVDRVMFMSGAQESVMLALFAQPANSQGYRPGYMLTSSAQIQALRSSLPEPQRPQFNGVGNAPTQDVDGAVPTAVEKRCLALVKGGGLAVGAYADQTLVLFHCGSFLVLEAALKVSGGDATAMRLAAAVTQLPTAFRAPSVVGGAMSFGSVKHDGPDMVQVFHYVDACHCMRYSGSPQRIP